MLDIVLKNLDKAVVNDVKIYDMKERTPFYDYSVVCSVNTSRQGMAAANYLKDDALKNNYLLKGYSIEQDSQWYLVDLGEVVVHIFVGEARDHYNLDALYTN